MVCHSLPALVARPRNHIFEGEKQYLDVEVEITNRPLVKTQ